MVAVGLPVKREGHTQNGNTNRDCFFLVLPGCEVNRTSKEKDKEKQKGNHNNNEEEKEEVCQLVGALSPVSHQGLHQG